MDFSSDMTLYNWLRRRGGFLRMGVLFGRGIDIDRYRKDRLTTARLQKGEFPPAAARGRWRFFSTCTFPGGGDARFLPGTSWSLTLST